MEIRSANSSDSIAIAQISRLSREQAMPYLPNLHTPEQDLAFFTSEIGSSDCRVALVEEQVVGFGCARDGWLNHLYISPEFQGKGIGSALLKSFGTDIEQFWVFQKNERARNFYQQHGFVEVEFTNGTGNEEKEPDVRFARKESGF
jgi:GNAT superfamily N-acetyltransferase